MKKFINTRSKESNEGGIKADLGGYENRKDVIYSIYDKENNGDTTAIARVSAPANLMEEITNKSFISVVTDKQVVNDSRVPFGNGAVGLESIDVPDVEVDQILNEYTIDDALTDVDKHVANIVLHWSELTPNDNASILASHNVASLPQLIETVSDDTLSKLSNEHEQFTGIPDHIDTATVARIVTQGPSNGQHVLQDQELTALDKAALCQNVKHSSEIPSSSRGETYNRMSQCACDIIDGSDDAHDMMLAYVKGDEPAPWK